MMSETAVLFLGRSCSQNFFWSVVLLYLTQPAANCASKHLWSWRKNGTKGVFSLLLCFDLWINSRNKFVKCVTFNFNDLKIQDHLLNALGFQMQSTGYSLYSLQFLWCYSLCGEGNIIFRKEIKLCA